MKVCDFSKSIWVIWRPGPRLIIITAIYFSSQSMYWYLDWQQRLYHTHIPEDAYVLDLEGGVREKSIEIRISASIRDA